MINMLLLLHKHTHTHTATVTMETRGNQAKNTTGRRCYVMLEDEIIPFFLQNDSEIQEKYKRD